MTARSRSSRRPHQLALPSRSERRRRDRRQNLVAPLRSAQSGIAGVSRRADVGVHADLLQPERRMLRRRPARALGTRRPGPSRPRLRKPRSASSVEPSHQRARVKPSARSVSTQAFSSREPWPRRWAGGSMTNSSISPSYGSGVRVGARHGRGEPDHAPQLVGAREPRAGDRDENPVPGARWSGDGPVPGIGHRLELDLAEDGRELWRKSLIPAATLDLRDRRRLGRQGQPDGVGTGGVRNHEERS